MKTKLYPCLAFLLLAAFPARADTASDLAKCETTVKQETGDIDDGAVALCMEPLGYTLDNSLKVDIVTPCGNLYVGIEPLCYRQGRGMGRQNLHAPAVYNWRHEKIDLLIAQEEGLNDLCRGGRPTLFDTERACNERSRIYAVLGKRGWCFQTDDGKNESEADKRWQVCH